VEGAPADGDLAALGSRLAALEGRVAALDARVAELEGAGGEFRRVLNRLGEALSATHDRPAMVGAVLETSALYLRAAAAAFFRIVPGRDVLRVTTTCGDVGGMGTAEVAAGEGVAGRAAAGGEVVRWPDPDAPDPAAVAGPAPGEPQPPPPAAATAIAVPVRVGGRPYGVLAVYGRRSGEPFSAQDVESLETLVRQVEPAIENTYLYEEAKRLSITDGLTSLWNRREFDLRMRQEHQRGVRFGEPFSIVLLDLDHFKDVNDRHGHQVGDAVLIEVARRLISSIREVDVVARIGGEEFGLILPNTPVEGALHLAAKVRAIVGGQPVETDGLSLPLTVSAGVASFPDHGRTPAELYGAADAALYRAKAGGRDRVEPASAAGSQRGPQASQGGA
jgi:diguanylate cyclase (GGDEF)-like protein